MIIKFDITQHGQTLRDALILPDDHELSETELARIQQERFDAWYAVITAASEE